MFRFLDASSNQIRRPGGGGTALDFTTGGIVTNGVSASSFTGVAGVTESHSFDLLFNADSAYDDLSDFDYIGVKFKVASHDALATGGVLEPGMASLVSLGLALSSLRRLRR